MIKQSRPYKRTITKAAELRYGHPGRRVHIIAVIGKTGKSTTTRLIAELLRESGKEVLEMMAASDSAHSFESNVMLLQKLLTGAVKQRFEYVVIEVHKEMVSSGAVALLDPTTLVVTSECPELNALLELPLQHAIVPAYLPVPTNIEPHHVMTFGHEDSADMRIRGVKLFRKGTEISFVVDQHNDLNIATHLIGYANARNVAAALATAYVLGIEVETFADGVARTEGVDGNYSYLPMDSPYRVVIDQGGTSDALAELLDTARELAKRRLIVALDTTVTTDELAELQKKTDRLIAVTNETVPTGVEQAGDHEEAAFVAVRGAKTDDLVLLVGRRYGEQDAEGRYTIAQSVGGHP